MVFFSGPSARKVIVSPEETLRSVTIPQLDFVASIAQASIQLWTGGRILL